LKITLEQPRKNVVSMVQGQEADRLVGSLTKREKYLEENGGIRGDYLEGVLEYDDWFFFGNFRWWRLVLLLC
jgi:hypothetical protein